MLDLKNGDTIEFKGKKYMIGELISVTPADGAFEGWYRLVFEDTKGRLHRIIVSADAKKEAAACD